MQCPCICPSYVHLNFVPASAFSYVTVDTNHCFYYQLTDFGLSKIGLINNTIDLSGPETDGIMPSEAHYPEYQQTDNRNRHSAVGTPDYLAPEILLGTEHGLNQT